MKDLTMNDSEIKDIDKLKNLLIEFGIEFASYKAPACEVVGLVDTYHGVEFYFNPDGSFNTWVVD